MADDMNMNTETAPETTEGQMGGKRSAWMTHVKKTMRANRGMKLKQVLKIAGKTYKKAKKGGALSPMPVSAETGPIAQAGGRRRRTSKKSRKGSKSRKH
jgi:hypothetical protein